MGAGEAFYVYLILLFQGFLFFWRTSGYAKATATRGEGKKEIRKVCLII